MSEPKPIVGWKRVAVRSLFIGVGITITLAALGGIALWYVSRPARPVPWKTHAIVADGPPGFGAGLWVSNDGNTKIPVLELTYALENTTSTDYVLDSTTQLQFMVRYLNGALGPNMFAGDIEQHEGSQNDVRLPLFIPAKQKAAMSCHLSDSELPTQNTGESDADYHERLRTYLEKTFHITGLVIFDQINHYEIDLPRWAATKPSNVPATKP